MARCAGEALSEWIRADQGFSSGSPVVAASPARIERAEHHAGSAKRALFSEPPSERHARPEPGEVGAWVGVSRQLEAAGFSPLVLATATSAPTTVAVRSALLSVLQALEARGRGLEKAALEAEAERARGAAADEARKRSDARYEQLAKTAASLEMQLSDAREALARSRSSSTASTRGADAELRSLKSRNQALALSLRQREAEIQRMQEKLQREVVERDAARRERERAVFAEAHLRPPRPSSATDGRALELVSAYESAQRNLQSEVEFLRAEVRRLSSELASAQNTISAKDSFGSWRTSDEGELLRRLAEAKKAADQAADDARRQLGMAAAKLRAAHTALAEARADAQQQRVRADNLQAEVASHAELASRSLEAASRSGAASTSRHEMALSSAATAAAAATAAEQQARASADLLRQELAGTGAALHRTTARLHESERRAAAAEEAAAKAAAVAASAGARDRAIVTEACHALRLVDGSQLPAAVRKLAAALSALPQMERWVREVCAITSAAAAGRVPNAADRGPPLSAGLTPERTLGELRKWAASKRELNHLREFAASLSADLAPVSQHKPAAGSHGVQGASNATGERVASPPTLGDLSAAVKSLVAAQLHNSPASTRDGRIDHRCKIVSTSGADEPETLTASPPSQPVGGRVAACAESHNASDPGLILAHFMRLFDVSSQEGVLPKANELFLFVQEQHTFLRVLRASLGESADAPPRALLQAVDKMVERARSARVSPKDSRSRDDSAPRLARDVVEELADANSLAPPTRPPPGHRPPPFAGVSGGEYMGSHANIETVAHPAEGEAKTAASAAADENRRLLDELCSLLDVSMNVELLPKVKDLLGHAHTLMRLLRVAQPDELVPALRAMIQQLRDETAELDEADQLITAVCDMLEVRSAHQVLPTLTLLLQESVVARSGPPASVVAADAYPLPQGATDLGSIASAAIEQSVAAPNGGITLPRDADNSSRACGYAPTSSNGPLSPRSMQLSMADASASRPAPFVDGHAAVGRSADAAPLSPMDGILGTTAKLKLGAYTSATSGDADAVPAPAVGTSALGTTPDEIVVLAIPGESSTAFAVDLATAADSLPELASSGKTFSATDLLTSDVTSGVFDGHAAEALQAVMPLLEKDFADYDDEEVKILDEYSSDDSILGAGYDEE